jgi:nickel-type superoxide dismutase maturation protease
MLIGVVGAAVTMPSRQRRRRAAWPILIGVVGAAMVFTRVVVEGDSMLPTLVEGDRLLVVRIGHRPRLRPGDLVTLRDPRAGGPVGLVKRVADLDGESADVRGDNPSASTDSRAFGRVPIACLTGKVLYRYGPPGRSGGVR